MDKNESALRVRRFIQGILDYYRMCSLGPKGPVTLTRQMASFALQDLSPSDLDAGIKTLASAGFINLINGDTQSFTANVAR
jgi:hypothetical protein